MRLRLRTPLARTRRGIALVLCLVFLFVLLIIGLAFFRLSRGVRRGTAVAYQRLQANMALNNTITEGLVLFLERVNTPGVYYDPEDEGGDRWRERMAKRRRSQVTDRNDAAYRRFMRRHRKAFDYQGDILDNEDEEDLHFDVDDPSLPAHIPPDEWYESFRERTEDFDVALPTPFSERLMSHRPSLVFSPVRVKVVEAEARDGDGNRKGTLSVVAKMLVKHGSLRFSRRMEKRFRYQLPAPAPAGTGATPPTILAVERPPVAVLVNGKERKATGA